MKGYAVIYKTELRLFTRDFFSTFFALVFPLMMLVFFGGLFGNAPVYEGGEMRMMDISVPAYAVMVIGVTGLMSLPLTLAGYKEKKIYKRFDATPAGKMQILAAQVLVDLTMTLAGILILVAAGKLLYQIRIEGAFFALCTGVLFSIGALFSMGFFFTAVGRDLKGTTLLCYLFYFVMLFLSGATVPDMLFSDTVKKLSGLLPMTYAVDLMQGLFAGDSLGMHGKELLILGLLTVLCTGGGVILYRNKDWT